MVKRIVLFRLNKQKHCTYKKSKTNVLKKKLVIEKKIKLFQGNKR